MIDDALLDVACPYCGAEVLELCGGAGGRYMESTVHYPRRVRADVPLEEEPAPKPSGRPKGAAGRPDPTKCVSGKHEWTDENVFTSPDGHDRCRPCRNERRRTRNQTKRQRPESLHRYNTNKCRQGHEYTAENTYVPPKGGARRCVTCKQLNRKKAIA